MTIPQKLHNSPRLATAFQNIGITCVELIPSVAKYAAKPCKKKTNACEASENYNKKCSVCEKKVVQPTLSIPCQTYKSFIHKKYTYFQNCAKSIPKTWMCSYCIETALPFSTLGNMDFFEFQYNSNFNCLCTKNT